MHKDSKIYENQATKKEIDSSEDLPVPYDSNRHEDRATNEEINSSEESDEYQYDGEDTEVIDLPKGSLQKKIS